MIGYFVNLNQKHNDLGSTKLKSISQNILSAELGISCQKVIIKRDAFGKPFLDGGKRHFNISYSGNKLLMVTDSTPIGVDIELVKELKEIGNIIEYFHPKEKWAYNYTACSEKLQFFYRLWVLKESYVKAIGRGLSCPLDSFYIRINKTDAWLACSKEKDLNWKFNSYFLPNGCVCAICARHDKFPVKFIDLEATDLLTL